MSFHLAPQDSDPDPYQVVVANLPEVLLRLITQSIDRSPHLILGAVAHDPVSILHSVTYATDVVLLGAPAVFPPPGIVSHLLSEYASLRVLVIAPQRNDSMAYWLQLRRERLKADSAASLTRSLVWLCQRDSLSME